MSRYPWNELGIEQGSDAPAIRRAYAERLKALDIDEDVAAYARLRDARDAALRMARMPAAVGAPSEADEPSLPIEYWEDSDEVDDEDFEWDIGTALAQHADVSYGPPVDLHAPSSPRDSTPPENPQLLAARLAWEQLRDLILPDGLQSDEGFLADEWQAAQAAFAGFSAAVDALPIDELSHADAAMADLLARGWPRSAPLVGRADEQFNWLAQEGKIGETPAQAFLNARLRGMRFHEAVQSPDHPLHKAWRELSAPKLPYWVSRWRVRRQDVVDVIGTVHTHFPELEAYFDPARSAKWEDTKTSAWSSLRFVLIAVFIGRALLSLLDYTPERPVGSTIAPPPAIESPQGTFKPERDASWREVFGEEFDEPIAGKQAPWFSRTFERIVAGTPNTGNGEEADRAALAFTRHVMESAVSDAPYADLVELQRVRLAWLRASRDQEGTIGCKRVMDHDFAHSAFVLSPDWRAREEALAVKLLHAGLLRERPPVAATRHSMPGEFSGAVLRTSHLSEAEFDRALDNVDDPNRCDLMIAYFQTLVTGKKVPAELMRFD